MILGDVLLDVFIFCLIGLFMYFNIASQEKFLKSYKIIVEDPDPVCIPDEQNLPYIDTSTLTKCPDTDPDIGDEYIYSLPEEGLLFAITENQGNSQNFFSICAKYCPPGLIGEQQECNERANTQQVKSYENCILLLQPEEGCADSSSPIGADPDKGKTFWVARAISSNKSCLN